MHVFGKTKNRAIYFSLELKVETQNPERVEVSSERQGKKFLVALRVKDGLMQNTLNPATYSMRCLCRHDSIYVSESK